MEQPGPVSADEAATLEPYFFQGTVHPQRASISLVLNELIFIPASSHKQSKIRISIRANQVAAFVYTTEAWNVFDLRNVVKTLLENIIAIYGFVTGHAHEVEVTRVIHNALAIDQVFGVDTPCLVELNRGTNVAERANAMLTKASGSNGVFLLRCLNDLASAMKHVNDTAFYCYRAIESLRHHCAAVHNMSRSDKSEQWSKLHEVTGNREADIRAIETAATPIRHGEPTYATDEERANVLKVTWSIVRAYVDQVKDGPSHPDDERRSTT